MTIAEIAALAGVTPRAVRHYHRVGVLPEPERRPNGYRDYDLADLTRLLRVRALIEAGVPLRRIATMAEPDAVAITTELGEVVADLHRQRDALDARIARLEELLDGNPAQDVARRSLADLTWAVDAPPGEPTAALLALEAETLSALAGTGRAPDVVSALGESYGAAAHDPAALEAVRHLAGAMASLDGDSTPGEISAVVDLLVALVPESVVAGMPAVDLGEAETTAWLGLMADAGMHPAVVEGFLARLAEREES